jgi:hypothetical protein
MAVSTLLDEIEWGAYGSPDIHTPIIRSEADCEKLDMLMDIMGALSRQMDTKIAYVTTDGKVVREWIERILEIGGRYRRELAALEKMEKTITL